MLQTRLTPSRSASLLAILLSILLIFLMSACSGTPQTTDKIAGVWVGEIEGSDAFVGISSNGNEVMAYLCDGQTISQWFHGESGVDALDLAAGTVDLKNGGAGIQAQLTLETASGSITLADGQTFNFQAERATGDAGLYRSEETVNNEKLVGGWVVLNDGKLLGILANLNTGDLKPQTSLSNIAELLGATLPRY